MELTRTLKHWIPEKELREKLTADLDYIWNTMEASGMATIYDKFNELEKIVFEFTDEYYKNNGSRAQQMLPGEIVLTVWKYFGLDPYAKH